MEASLFYTKLEAELHGLSGREEHGGREVAVLRPEQLLPAVALLMQDVELAFDMLIDLGGADYSAYPDSKHAPLCVSYQFYSSSKNLRAWLKVYLPMENPELDSLSSIFAGANWYERECWDMYGIVFKGHPYLKRLLLYDEFVGHPLRKDYPIMKSQPLIPMRNAVDYENVAMKRREEEGKS
jgi:NADH:ubiquinone oxidoreductase subunit C